MTVRGLYFYPVKGLSPQALERVALTAGRGFTFDRMFGLARADSGLDPLRFRANLYFDGFPPFAELDLVGRELRAGGVMFRILKRIDRCAATEVNLQTAQRDIPVPRLPKQHYNHVDMGVYGEVLTPAISRSATR